MAQPQSAIIPEAGRFGLFLTLRVREGGAAAVRRVARTLPARTAALARRTGEPSLVSALGIGSACWDEVIGSPRPGKLAPFKALRDGPRTAPSTPADLFLHLHSERHDANFALAREVVGALGDAVETVEEILGFHNMVNRDLTGFVDGTENPKGEDRAAVAIVGDEEPALAGGSYVSVQRYVHDLASWEKLAVREQEAVIGRTKVEDQELPEGVKPPTAHIARVVIEEDGEELELLRHSMPYGTTAAAGLYFVGYGRTPETFQKMLARMLVSDAQGHHDHLMHFSKPVTGASFFVPSVELLERLPD